MKQSGPAGAFVGLATVVIRNRSLLALDQTPVSTGGKLVCCHVTKNAYRLLCRSVT